jgi:hypothetical protein
MCLFLSMVVWQPFDGCWRYIIARVSEMHVAYHKNYYLVGYLHQRNIQQSTSQTTSWYLSFFPSFLTCIVECVCVCRRRGGIADIECDWRCVSGDSSIGRYSVKLLQFVVVICLFLSMVVWQPFRPCWRYIIARVSEMHVAYHSWKVLWVIYISGTNNIKHLQRLCDTTPSIFPSLPASSNVCLCGREERGDSGYRVWLNMGVRSLFDRRLQCQVITACCCHVFVPQYGRLAAVFSLLAFNHCACLRNARRISYLTLVLVYLHPWNKQHSTSQKTSWYLSFSPSLPASSNVCVCVGGEGGIADIECDWRCVLGDSWQEGTVRSNNSFLLSCVCSSVWLFGSHLSNWR